MRGLLKKYGTVTISLIASAFAVAVVFAAYAVFGGSTGRNIVKLNPSGLSVGSSGAWVDDASAWSLFDRDTTTAYAPAASPARVMVTLPAAANISYIKVYGSAAYNLAVYDGSSGAWVTVPGLDNIALKSQPSSWNTFAPTSALNTNKLMLEFTAAGGNAGGIKEIEIWGADPGDPTLSLKNVKTPSDLQTILASTAMPYHLTQLAASPQSIDVPADGNTHAVSFTLGFDPRLIKRAYLLYDSYNADYPVSPEKRINGLSWTGGFVPMASDTPAWTSQLEAINPSWLVQGSNLIEFRNQGAGQDPSTYSIRNLQVVLELENGWNMLSSAAGTAENANHPAQAVIDGDLTTYFELKSTHTLDLKAERTIQPDTIRINLWSATATPSGTITLQYLQANQWKNFASGGVIDMSTLQNGWNDIKIPTAVATDTVRLAISVTPDKKRQGATVGGINEVELIGSPIGARTSLGLVVNYPLNGEYFGRTAYIEGFIDPASNPSGTVQIDVSGKAASNTDGSFSLSLSKDETSYASQADNDPWQAVAAGTYPDGAQLTQTIALSQNILNSSPSNTQDSSLSSSSGRERFSEMVAPGQAKTIKYKGVTLDIPAGAVDKETEITIIPLTEADLSRLNPGMINVTYPDAGYRFLPRGMKFKQPIKISFGYSKQLFAAGQTDDEVNMYYYDETLLRWQQLSRVKVDPAASQVTSSSTHFTDIINSTLVVPEHPEALSFNPNSIKDIKAADPGANIDLIEPPKANNKGTANLSYPIEIPKGRGAYTPDLRVTYSSTNENGWMGLGWDVSIPSIKVDTRWGVPTYNPTYETESYLFAGHALAPVFKLFDNPAVTRKPDLQFYKRVEGDFLKIIRKGSSPKNYYWEVTDKSGVRYYYGLTPQARLADYKQGNENIFEWFLEKVVDTNGNVTTYSYYTDTQQNYLNTLFDPANPPNNALGGENWVQLYLDNISYTDNVSKKPNALYSVTFVRDGGNRPDLIIGGKSGFKTAMRFRLAGIIVKFKDQTIRSYAFDYITGDFSKSLLNGITVKGANGAVLANHSFDYYRMDHITINSESMIKGFADSESWTTPIGDVLTKIDEHSAGHTHYKGYSSTTMRQFSKGRLTGNTSADIDTSWKLQDLNGDGLPDIVGQGMVYYNLGGPGGTNSFGPGVAITGLPVVEKESRETDSSGNADYIGPVSLSDDMANTVSKNCAMLTDVNGDGFADLVQGTQVFYNRVLIDQTFAKDPKWNFSSNLDLPSLNSWSQEMQAYRKAHFYLVDPVRKWFAPFAGDITITGVIQKKKREDALEISNKDGDGVTFSLYRNNTLIGKLTIAPGDYTAHQLGELVNNSGSNSIELPGIQAGDRLYFILDSIDNGENDEIVFDPVISYQTVAGVAQQQLQTLQDDNGRPMYSYQASTDFTLADTNEIISGASRQGTIALTGQISKLTAPDDVHVVIETSTDPNDQAWTVFKDYSFTSDDVETVNLNETLDVQAGERLRVSVYSDHQVDPSRVAVDINAVYTEVMLCGMSDDFSNFNCQLEPVTDPTQTDIEGNPLYQFKPQVNYPLRLTVPRASQATWVAPYDGEIYVDGTVDGSSISTPFTVWILGINKSFWKQQVDAGGTASSNVGIPVSAGDQLFFEVYSEDPQVTSVSWSPTITYTQYCPSGPGSCTAVTCLPILNNGTQCTPPGIGFIFSPPVQTYYHDPDEDEEPFSGGFRQWYYGEWNGNNPWNESLLVQPPDPAIFTRMLPATAGTLYSGGQPVWTATEPRSFIAASMLGSSRLAEGASYACPPDGVLRQSTGTNSSNGESGPIGGTQNSSGSTSTQIEFLDFNGDGYPDLVTPDGVFLSDGVNGLVTGVTITPGPFRTITNHNRATNIGVGSIVNMINSAAKTMSVGAAAGGGSGSSGFSIWNIFIPSLDYSVGGSDGTSSTTSDLIDVNGDGLPDLVTANPALSTITVQLNLGNRFGAAEQWSLPGGGNIGEDSNRMININLGLDILNSHFGASYGVALAVAKTKLAMVDINGDGLPDMVSKNSDDDFMSVRINQGGSFGPVEKWYIPSWRLSPPESRGTLDFWTFVFGSYIDSYGLDELLFDNDTLTNKTTETYTDGNFANGFMPIFKLARFGKKPNPLWLILGWENSSTRTTVRSQIDFVDIDGDGLPDHVLKNAHDTSMEVKRNLAAKANLLKSVKRPLGGSFTLDYVRKGNKVDYSNPNQLIDMQKSYWVLSKVTLNDGIKDPAGATGQLKNVYETSYSYDSGYYSRAEREFYGFHTVAETRGSGPDTVTAVQTYNNQDYYLKGLLLGSTTRAGAIADINTIQGTQNPAYVSTVDEYLLRPGSDPNSQFPSLSKTTVNFYDVAAQTVAKTTSQEYLDYDQYGNLLEYVDHADGTGNDIQVSISYDKSNEALYIVNKPQSIDVKDASGKTFRSRTAHYEAGTGNLKDLSMLIDQGKSATWNFTYDPDNGNLATITYPQGDPSHNTSTKGYELDYTYDDQVQTYVTAIVDSFGYSSAAGYDYRFGLPIWQQDINGNYQVNVYDDFGRIAAVYGPCDTNGPNPPAATTPTLAFVYAPPALDADGNIAGTPPVPASALTSNKSSACSGSTQLPSQIINTITFADGMKRIVQTRKDASINGVPSVVASGTVVFDTLGRVVQQGQPVPTAGYTYGPVELRRPMLFTYDTLDRATMIQTPDANAGGYAKTVTDYGFGVPPQGGGVMFKTRVTDPNNFVSIRGAGKGVKESYRNAHDKIVAVVEYNNGQGIATTYAYDIMDQLLQVLDAKNHATTMTYDLMGRRLSIDNPDTGLTSYAYDANGNVTTKQTANLKKDPKYSGQPYISYNYEYNRLKTISYPASTAVTYEYGGPTDTADNQAGRIKQITDESGIRQLSYGRLGETTKELRQINASNNPVAKVKFETDYIFDSFGRMVRMTYPDGEILSYLYDAGGLLKHAEGVKRGNRYIYVDNLLYDEFGQRTMILYGNKVKTTYAYEPDTRRLSRLTTVLPSGRTIQDSIYKYDLVGNIMQLGTDSPALIPAGGLIGGPTIQYFTYDDLYQLVTANGAHWSANNKRTTYTDTIGYDTIGNITGKVQTHLLYGTTSSTAPLESNYSWSYYYNGTQPHAVTNIADVLTRVPLKNYTYDSDGNMLGWTSQTSNASRTITWNEENRVKNITDSGNGTTFVYDDAGERVIKRGSGNETVYVNRFYAVKNGDLGTKHIFAGNTRVVTKLEKDGGGLQTGVPGSIALVNSQGIPNAVTRGNGRQIGINRRLTSASGTGGAINPPIEKFEFFYHGDHLGSSNFITDDSGAVYQDLEYFPYGEQWVEDGGTGQMPMYRFTGQEFDPETGLYYFGARYYDPVLSRWISADPVLDKYIPKIKQSANERLAGEGGIFKPINLNFYTYSHENPIKFIDPDGKAVLDFKYLRMSTLGDLPDKTAYPIVGYAVYNYKSIEVYNAAALSGTLTRPIGFTELSFEARELPNRGNILGDSPKWAQMYYAPTELGVTGTKHQIFITDIGAGTKDYFTVNNKNSFVYGNYGQGFTDANTYFENVRAHAGGPCASKGCATSPHYSYTPTGRADFNAEMLRQVPSLGTSEPTFINIPDKNYQFVPRSGDYLSGY